LARSLSVCLVLIALLITACQDSDDTVSPPDTQETLREAAQLISEAETFSLEVVRTGALYVFDIDLGDGVVEVGFNRAIGQFISPDEIGVDVTVSLDSRSLEIPIYADGPVQWYKPPLLPWVQDDFAEGFNPAVLQDEDTGFQTVLSSLVEINYEEATSINGVPAYHFTALAEGEGVSSLIVGLIDLEGLVPVDVYIHRETGYPVRVIVEQPNTANEDDPNTRWQIDIFDYNAEVDIERPEG
jgi:hypothetical protein